MVYSVDEFFSGQVYVNSDTAKDVGARRFETTETKLVDVVVFVETEDQLFGDASGQTFPRAAGTGFGFTSVDISTLYFRDASPLNHGTVHILGVRE